VKKMILTRLLGGKERCFSGAELFRLSWRRLLNMLGRALMALAFPVIPAPSLQAEQPYEGRQHNEAVYVTTLMARVTAAATYSPKPRTTL